MHADEPHPTLRPDEVLGLHEAVQAKVRRDSAPLLSAWFPLAVFGAFSVLSGVAALLFGASAFVVVWAVAGPVGFLAVVAYFWRLEVHASLRVASPQHAVAIAAAIVAAAFVIADSGPAGPFFGVAAGYLAFGVLWSSRTMFLCAAGCAAIATAVALTDPSRPEIWLGLGVGLTQLVCSARDRVHPPGGP